MHAIPIERNTFDSVTGTCPELSEKALNIICISLKFLHTSAWNPPIVLVATVQIVHIGDGQDKILLLHMPEKEVYLEQA